MNKQKHWLDSFDEDSLLIASTRYHIGRATIATCCFAKCLADAWESIPELTRFLIKKDIEEAFERDDSARQLGFERNPLGMDCDCAAWEKVRKHWKP